MSCHTMQLRLPKDAPLRKPSPVWASFARRSGHICGGYVRIGSRCYFLLWD